MNFIPRKGLNVPTITVVDESGCVIEGEQRRVFRHVIQQGSGADVIFANGTTGEWNRLRNYERQRVIEFAVDEVRTLNNDLFSQGRQPVEVWAGLNGSRKQEVLDNLDAAIQLEADAVVIAPLAINDLAETDIVRFFHREMTTMIEAAPREMPVLLYDNADINAPGRTPHIRTHVVKELSRLPWLCGIKVSAPRRVLGNYTKAALHFKQPGEFGIYVGNAMLIFDWFRPQHGFVGRLRAGLNEWLLHDALPIGVVSGPGNVLPREWQKAWRVCWSGDEEQMNLYQQLCVEFETLTSFALAQGSSGYQQKMIACLKYALELEGVLDCSLVANGTAALTRDQQQQFAESYQKFQRRIHSLTDPRWQTTTMRATSATFN